MTSMTPQQVFISGNQQSRPAGEDTGRAIVTGILGKFSHN
jgi:hypothetical protein